MSRLRRPAGIAAATLAAVLACAPAAPAAAVAGSSARTRISAAYELPGDRVYPEGIAVDPRTGDLYAGSFADGTIYKMTPGKKVAQIFLPAGADGRDTANGLKVDGRGRLWVTDSTAGVSVYDARSRRLLARFDVPGQGKRFVNDLAVTPDGTAYLTDSSRAVIYRVTPEEVARAGGRPATLTPAFDLGDVLDPHGPDTFTLNGIVADPLGRYLLTVDMTGGDLYRVDLASGAIGRVDLRGGDMAHADGLELRRGKLWIAHNTTNTISRWRVAEDGYSARRERQVTDIALQIPTTLVRAGERLYVVRSQFDKGGPMGAGTPQRPFTVAAVAGI